MAKKAYIPPMRIVLETVLIDTNKPTPKKIFFQLNSDFVKINRKYAETRDGVDLYRLEVQMPWGESYPFQGPNQLYDHKGSQKEMRGLMKIFEEESDVHFEIKDDRSIHMTVESLYE